LLLLATACQHSSKADAQPAASVTAGPATSAGAASSASSPSKPWFEGAWQGAFQAELFRVEVPAGGAKEWKQDDGKKASGEGRLSFEAAPDGSVLGSATGALGSLALSGRIEGDRAALVLRSEEAEGFHGMILAAQTPEGMQGTLNASSGSSLQARQANVTISRATK
jgi:hypothetical protein